MTFTTKLLLFFFFFVFCFFGVPFCGLKLLPNNWLVLTCARMRCLKTFDSFAFKMYFQTEAVMVKMIQVDRPVNCLEFM